VSERILLGPGPSMVPARVMQAMAAPVLSHLDPDVLATLDDVRERLGRVFNAPDGSFALATSGTGTSGMEAVVANMVKEGTRVLVVVTGYFGERLADICRRYGAVVTRVDAEWGRAADPQAVRKALAMQGADIVACVHGETSTGVLNPIRDIAQVAHERGALVIVDAVTTLGGHPVDVAAWGLDAVYSCTQKGIGAPSGMSPVVFTPEALARKAPCRSFYLDLTLLEDYWVRRKYHHTLSSTLLFALREALTIVEEETLRARWARHEQHHRALARGLEVIGLELLPPEGERLWTLNAVRVPAGVDDLAVRQRLLKEFNIEVGPGLGPLAGKVWRVGLMGAGSTRGNLVLFLGALEHLLHGKSHGATAAAMGVLDDVAASL
jgi:alanine-glyoxylate transaminase / serine-glyoxylate transaminase / serine-pyruvate transaminase